MPRVSERWWGLCPTEAESLAEERWSPREAPKPTSDPDKRGKQAIISAGWVQHSSPASNLIGETFFSKVSLGSFSWNICLLFVSPLAHLFQGLVNRHPDSPLSTSPTPTAHPHLARLFCVHYFPSTITCKSYFKPHFYLGLFFMKLLLHMKGFPSLRVYNRTGTSFWILK